LSGTSHPRDPPHVGEEVTALKRLIFDFEKLGNVEEIPVRLEIAEAEPAHRIYASATRPLGMYHQGDSSA